MGAIKKFLKILESSKKKQIVFFVVSMLVLFITYAQMREYYRIKNAINISTLEDYKVLFNITEMKTDIKSLYISGWGFRLDSEVNNMWILLESSSNTVIMDTQKWNEDEETLYSDAYFTAESDLKKINENECYKIYLAVHCSYEDEGGGSVSGTRKVFTGKYLYNNRLYQYDPLLFVEPEVESDNMKTIIAGGKLLFYDEEIGIWIYLFEQNMYYITNLDFQFSDIEETYFPCHVYEFEGNEVLGSASDYQMRNMDFYFEKNEWLIDNSYKIARITLPNRSISWIKTGVYNVDRKAWYWNVVIPMMEFQLNENKVE